MQRANRPKNLELEKAMALQKYGCAMPGCTCHYTRDEEIAFYFNHIPGNFWRPMLLCPFNARIKYYFAVEDNTKLKVISNGHLTSKIEPSKGPEHVTSFVDYLRAHRSEIHEIENPDWRVVLLIQLVGLDSCSLEAPRVKPLPELHNRKYPWNLAKLPELDSLKRVTEDKDTGSLSETSGKLKHTGEESQPVPPTTPDESEDETKQEIPPSPLRTPIESDEESEPRTPPLDVGSGETLV